MAFLIINVIVTIVIFVIVAIIIAIVIAIVIIRSAYLCGDQRGGGFMWGITLPRPLTPLSYTCLTTALLHQPITLLSYTSLTPLSYTSLKPLSYTSLTSLSYTSLTPLSYTSLTSYCLLGQVGNTQLDQILISDLHLLSQPPFGHVSIQGSK